MKIVFCIKAMNNLGGGAERVLSDVANGLASRSHQVAVLTLEEPGGESFYPLDKKIERIDMGIGSTTNRATVFGTVRRIKSLRSKMQEYAPDVVIGFMHSIFIPLGFALARTKIPLISSEHAVPKHYKTRPLQALLLFSSPFFSKQITCVSDQVVHSYPWLIRRKMIGMENPVCVSTKQRANTKGRNNEKNILLTVGRLEEEKAHHLLIEAFSVIADRVPNWDLHIVGDGVLRNQLSALITKIGLNGRVKLLGTVKEIAEKYLSSQLFVLPSHYESFGLTLIEAQARGLPAIGFDDCQGVNALIRHGINGTLVDSNGNKIENLALSMLELMDNDNMRVQMSNQLEGVPEPYKIENVLDKWEKLILETIHAQS